MSKDIQKVVIFYTDGTFTEIGNVQKVQEFGDRPITPDWFSSLPRPCFKCGIDLNKTSGSCGNLGGVCPSGRGFPPINPGAVQD
jgi:hypothetical protein